MTANRTSHGQRAQFPGRRPGTLIGHRARSALGGVVGLGACLSMAAMVAAQSPDPSGPPVALPVWIAAGSCEAPGETIAQLEDAEATGHGTDGPAVHVARTVSEQPLEEQVTSERVLLAGGSDAESAVVCGDLIDVDPATTFSGIALRSRHGTDHFGTATFLRSDTGSVIEVVVVVPAAPPDETSPAPSAAASPDAAQSPGGSPSAGPSVVPPPTSPLPGTSGAPPFSPLPAGSTSP